MKFAIFWLSTLLIGNFAFASTLDMNFQAKDLSVKSLMTFTPGNSIKFDGKDASGKPFVLEVVSSRERTNALKLTYNLSRNGKLEQSGTILTKVNEPAKIDVATEGSKEQTSFSAKVSE